MNRAARRALKRLVQRSGAHRPAAGPTVDERLAALEAENAQLKDQVQALDAKHDQVPGVASHRKDWYVLVGGERVDLKAIPPAEWLRTLEELPQFLFAFALQKTEGKALDGETLEQITDLAKRWIAACAVEPDELQLDRLTLPEAEHAVAHIAELNGVTAHLRAWFRKRLAGVAAAAPGSEELRDAPERPAGDLPN